MYSLSCRASKGLWYFLKPTHVGLSLRHASTLPPEAPQPPKPVDLAYSEYIPEDGNRVEEPLVILHGLFGSKRNWGSLCKAFCRDLNRPVYALDLRNHGESPSQRPMTYSAMAADVEHFIKKNKFHKTHLLGHSMGGKVAMTVTLNEALPDDSLLKAIVVDIAPSTGRLSREFISYVEAMKKVNEAKIKTRKEATEILQEYEKDTSITTFLMTNLEVPKDTSQPAHIRLPLDILEESIEELGKFPYERGDRIWDGPILFIKGENSPYINERNFKIASSFYSNIDIKVIRSGHWVHAEKPEEFKNVLYDFIRQQ